MTHTELYVQVWGIGEAEVSDLFVVRNYFTLMTCIIASVCAWLTGISKVLVRIFSLMTIPKNNVLGEGSLLK